MRPRVALVTGGRRGIGRATALALSGKGLRVVVSSRQPALLDDSNLVPVQIDLADRRSIDSALTWVADEIGCIDVLVNNALCDQPGSQVAIRDMDFDAFEAMVMGELINTVYLTRQVIEAAAGATVTVVNVGSAAAEHIPPVPVGQGGWAFSYAASKAAFHRLAPFLQLEYGDAMRAFTVNPGFVRTEALLERLGDVPGSAPPEVPASVIAWLATEPAADRHKGSYIHAQEIAAGLGGHP